MSLETLHTGLSSDTDGSVAPSSTAVQGVTQAAHSESVHSEGVHSGSVQSVAADEVSEVVVQTTRDLADARYWLEGDDLVLSISGQPGLEGQGIEQIIRVTDWATAEFQPGFRALDGGVLDADLVGKLAGSHSATAQSGSATGLTEIGFVDNVSGEVFVLRGGEEHRLKVGDPIFQHDEVVTSDEGAVGFVFQDESTFSIAQDARMVMDEFVYDPVSQTGYTEMSILKGAFTFASGLIADSNPTDMLITTPQAVIGVRGTAGGGLVNPDGESQFFNTDGAISVTTDVGVTVIDQVFETTFVTSRDAAPSAPVLSEAQDLLGRFSQVLEASPSALNSISTLSQVQASQNTDDQESDDQELEDEESGSPTDVGEVEDAGTQAEGSSTGEEELVAEDSTGEEELVAEDSIGEEELVAEDSIGEEELVAEDSIREEEPVAEDSIREEEPVAEDSIREEEPVAEDSIREEEPVGEDSIREEEPAGEEPIEKTDTGDLANLSESIGVTGIVVTESSESTPNSTLDLAADLTSTQGPAATEELARTSDNTAPVLLPTPAGKGAFAIGDGILSAQGAGNVVLSGQSGSVFSGGPVEIVLRDSHGHSQTVTTTASENGSFSVTADLTDLLDGVLTADLTSTAPTGQILTSRSTASMQTTGVIGYLESDGSLQTFADGDGFTNSDAQTIAGVGVAGHTVRVSLIGQDGSLYTQDVVVSANGNWSTSTSEIWSNNAGNIVELPDDTYAVSAARLFGGVSGAAALSERDLTIDTTPPSAHVVIDSISDDTGILNTDFITSDNNGLTLSATLSAALTAGERLEYSTDGGTSWTDITGSVDTASGTAVTHTDTDLTSSKTVQMRVTDAAGNSGLVEDQLITIDTEAPTTTATIDSISDDTGTLNTDFITKDVDGLTIYATLSEALGTGERLEYSTDGGASWTDITDNVSGKEVTFSEVLTEDTTVQMRATDEAGNSVLVGEKLITIDTEAPTTTVTSINGISVNTGTSDTDFITNDVNGLTISATLSAALTAGEILEYSTDGGASWINITNSVDIASGKAVSYTDAFLTDSKTVQMRVTDEAGNSGLEASQQVIIDATPPTTTVTINSISDDTGILDTDFITSDNDGLTIQATLSAALDTVAGERLEYSPDGGTSWIDITESSDTTIVDDKVTYTDSSLTTEGSATVEVQMRVTDAAGNSSTAAKQEVTIDAEAPTTTVTIDSISDDTGPASDDTGASNADFRTSDNDGLTIYATLSDALGDGEILEYSTDEGASWTDITDSSNTTIVGRWVSYTDSSLTTEGLVTVQMRVTDEAGNSGLEESRPVEIDTAGPTSITVAINSISNDTVTLANFTTNNNTNGLTINASLSRALGTDEILEYSRNGTDWTDISNSVPSGGMTVSYADGLLVSSTTVYMRITDTVGNVVSEVDQPINVDVTPPTTTVTIDSISDDTGILNTDFITSDNDGLTISAILSAALDKGAGEILEYSTDGTSWTDITGSVDIAGTAVTYTDGSLTDSATVYMRVMDAAKNSGEIASQYVEIDTEAPTTMVTIDSISDDTGFSNADFITNDNGLTIHATLNQSLAKGERVEYSTDNGTNWTDSDISVEGKAVTVPVSFTEDTTVDIQMRVTDAAGNPGPVASRPITIDTKVNEASVTGTDVSFSEDTGVSSGDRITNDQTTGVTVTLTDSLASDETLEISADGGTTWNSATSPDSGTTWQTDSDVTLLAGTGHTITARIVDTAGNIADISLSNNDYTLDTVSPDQTIALSISNDTGTSNSDFITSDNDGLTVTATFNQPLQAGEYLEYRIGSDAPVVVPGNAGDTSVAFDIDSAGDGDKILTVHLVDAAGNVGAAISQNITIDTSAPGLDLSDATSGTHFVTETFEGNGVSLVSGTTPITEIDYNIQSMVLQMSGAQAGDELRLNGSNILSVGGGSTTLSGNSVTYTVTSDAANGYTVTLTGNWATEQANTILSSSQLEFVPGSGTDGGNRVFDLTVEDMVGNVSDIATTAVRVRSELSLDLGSGLGANHTAAAVLATGETAKEVEDVAYKTSFIASQDVTVTGPADSIFIKVSDGSASDKLIINRWIQEVNSDRTGTVIVDVETLDPDYTIHAIDQVDVNVTGDPFSEGITITKNTFSTDKDPFTADEIETILRDIRYMIDPSQSDEDAAPKVEITLNRTIGDNTVSTTATSTIPIFGTDTVSNFGFDLSGEGDTSSSTTEGVGRLVSAAAAAQDDGVTIGDNQAAIAGISSLKSLTLTLHGYRDGDLLKLIDPAAVIGGTGTAEIELSSYLGTAGTTIDNGGGNPMTVTVEDGSPPQMTLSFDTAPLGSADTNALLRQLTFETVDGIGARAIQLDATVTKTGEPSETTLTSVFEVQLGESDFFNFATSWAGVEASMAENGFIYSSPPEVGEGHNILQIPDTTVDMDLVDHSLGIDVFRGSSHYNGDGESVAHQTFQLTDLPNGVEYEGGVGVADTLEFKDSDANNTTALDRVIDLNSLDKVVGTFDGFELINLLDNNTNDTLTFNGAVVEYLSDASEGDKAKLTVDADSGDTVDLGGEFSLRETASGYSAYESEDSVVYITEDTNVTGLQGG